MSVDSTSQRLSSVGRDLSLPLESVEEGLERTQRDIHHQDSGQDRGRANCEAVLSKSPDFQISCFIPDISSTSMETEKLYERLQRLEELAKYQGAHISTVKIRQNQLLSIHAAPRTCNELKSVGVTLSGVYSLDPDGPNTGYRPIEAYCDLRTGKTQMSYLDIYLYF